VKLHVVASALRLRHEMHPFFIEADYVPLAIAGARARHVVALARTNHDATVVAVAARLPASLCSSDGAWAPAWRDTSITLPESWPRHRLRDVFTGTTVEPGEPALAVSGVLDALPVALLVAD
jgi:(1->4)-alpha-D-glucan 1-alpha-D-glucosylmutase